VIKDWGSRINVSDCVNAEKKISKIGNEVLTIWNKKLGTNIDGTYTNKAGLGHQTDQLLDSLITISRTVEYCTH
jgi:phage-related minor tail protein